MIYFTVYLKFLSVQGGHVLRILNKNTQHLFTSLMMQEFDGNIDENSVVYHDLNPPITARYIRFLPVEWEDEISLRVELYGCVKGKENGFPLMLIIIVYITVDLIIGAL